MKLGIVGFGVVGKACFEAFNMYNQVFVNDIADIAPIKNYSLAYLRENCEAIFICVPTPTGKDGLLNTTILYEVIEELCTEKTKQKPLIIIKSTVPVGTLNFCKTWFPKWHFAFNPEFLREKTAASDMMVPDRLVFGVNNKADLEVLKRIYAKWSCPIVTCKPVEAELIKLLSNTFLSLKVAFSCEMKQASKHFGADASKVFEGVSLDQRITPSHLKPLGKIPKDSPCLPKDLVCLVAQFESPLFRDILDLAVEN